MKRSTTRRTNTRETIEMHVRKLTALFTLVAPIAALALGMPKLGGGGGGLSAAQIDSFVKKAQDGDKAMMDSARKLFDAVASKEEKEAEQAKLAAAQAKTDKKEQEAAVKDANASLLASLNGQEWEGKTAERVKTLSEAQLNSVVSASGDFLVAAANNVGLVKQGQEMAKQTPDMSAASRMGDLTGSVSNLATQAKSAGNVAVGVQKLFKSAKIELPADAVASLSQITGGI